MLQFVTGDPPGRYAAAWLSQLSSESARGRKAGEFLLAAMIERAKALGADPLYLLTNSRCAPAIHLYEKAGFQHDA